jgi:hypothetical protein
MNCQHGLERKGRCINCQLGLERERNMNERARAAGKGKEGA